MLNIAICDDDEAFASILSKRVASIMQEASCDADVTAFTNGSDLIESSADNKYDLILLDIDMPGLDGFHVSSHLRKNNINSDIIFISGRENFVFQSIKYRPFRFIRKSCLDSEITEGLNDYLVYFTKKNALCTFHCEECYSSVQLRKIVYFECYNHDISMHLNDGSVLALHRQHNLRSLENDLSKYGFIRTHKSYIVNYKYIYLVKETDIFLDNGEVLPSTKKRIPEVRAALNTLIMEEV